MRLIGLAAFAAMVLFAAPAMAAAPAFDPEAATRAWLDTMGPEATARSNRYFEGGYIIAFVGPILSIAISMVMMMLGWAKSVRSGLEKTVKLYFLVALGMALFYQFVSTVLTFPFSYYVGFVREHEFGLSTQDFAHWFTEYLQASAIGLAIGAIAIALLYLIIRATKRTWWIWGTIFAGAFAAVAVMLAPVYIAPIFNEYQPMREGALKVSILQMAQANGVPVNDVLEFDISRQTNRVTANVSGFLDTTRVSLSDTLIERASPGAVRSVMGHEIGHYVLRHVMSILLMLLVLIAITFALANLIFERVSKGERWGVRGVADPAGMPLLFAIISFLGIISMPINNNIVRFHESQADIFGLNASREPDGFAEAALLLSEYRKMEPSALEEWFFYDHPSGYARVRMAMQWKAHEMAAGRYPAGPGGPPAGWRPDFVVMSARPENAPSATVAPAEPAPPASSPAAP
ncbi:M48 family metallopeptidase [Terricaulis silvestris]|uniref:Peptidase family M48 n=1 Tax=Terricaulis silvestris TaxID=2686094 RepID=A0A6I6MN88_9CAUL|nr:M48 family metallopeptidase [Terricaulis silvestris]QGZ96995.1 Peptidase family M48 [Terricaulis silvestris]